LSSADVADPVDSQGVAVVPDNLHRLLQKRLRAAQKLAAPPALPQNAIHGGGGEQGLVADDGDEIRQRLVAARRNLRFGTAAYRWALFFFIFCTTSNNCSRLGMP